MTSAMERSVFLQEFDLVLFFTVSGTPSGIPPMPAVELWHRSRLVERRAPVAGTAPRGARKGWTLRRAGGRDCTTHTRTRIHTQ